jgi:GWxTD domain-containing protein
MPEMKRYSCLVIAIALGVAFPSCSSLPRNVRQETAKARRSLAEGDTLSAIRRIERVNLKKNPDPQLYVMLGRLYRELGTIKGRLQSQQLLEQGQQVFPENADILTELGKTYFAQTFYPDAIRVFRNALKLDPGRCEAHRYIGLYYYNNWQRLSQYEDDLLAARRHFDAAVACDSTDKQSAIRLGRALYALKRTDAALEFSRVAMRLFPGEADFHLLRGAIAYEDGRFDDAQKEFDRGLARMRGEMAREYADLFPMLEYGERFLYEQGRQSKRDVIERGYWIAQDPDPTTSINERHLEHVYRMFVSDVYFSCYRPPLRGWQTERGAAVVKFGWPWNIERTLGDSWDSGRIEKWYYIRRGKMRQFVFEDEYLSGNLRIPYYADSMVVVLRYDPRVSSYQSTTIPVPGAMDVAVFKDDQFSSTVYLAARIDADSLRHAVDLRKVNHFCLRGAFFDDEWRAERRFADTLWTSDLPLVGEHGRRYFYVGRSLSLPFDSYQIACAFEDESGSARALFKSTGDSFRFAQDGLAISDILFEDPTTGRAESLTRKGRTLYPNPGRVYADDQRLLVYFEVYGLGLAGNRSDYEVTFYIYKSPEEPPSTWARIGGHITDLITFGSDSEPEVSQTFRRSGVDHTALEEMAINIDSLKSGRYGLVISIVDGITGDSAHISGAFFKR